MIAPPGPPSPEPGRQPTHASCFLRGTRILTPMGERAIEDLRVGDLVSTLTGPVPIKWIPRQVFRREGGSRWAPGVAPVLVRANALAPGRPCRDLFVSPQHAFYLEGMLIEAKHLVDGQSILNSEMECDLLEYFNIELEGCSVVFANGAAVETYSPSHILDRERFANFAEYVALYPGDAYRRYPAFASRATRRPDASLKNSHKRLVSVDTSGMPGLSLGWRRTLENRS